MTTAEKSTGLPFRVSSIIARTSRSTKPNPTTGFSNESATGRWASGSVGRVGEDEVRFERRPEHATSASSTT